MCLNALKAGYRHFDTASGYGNEKEVGRALRDSGIPRDEIYITTKLPNHMHHAVAEAFEQSLRELDLEYIDLYLMHWPQATVGSFLGEGPGIGPNESPTYLETWHEMEKLLAGGKVKSIGISNFGIPLVENLLKYANIVPAVNQVEAHPNLPQAKLKAFCESKGILLEAYSPLGGVPVANDTRQTFLNHPGFVGVAERLGITPGQLAVSWGVQRGTSVVPKSENPQRMKANITIAKLGEEDMAVVDAIHKEPMSHRSLVMHYLGSSGTLFGWTYEQLGWEMNKDGYVLQ
jgi:glycerol 2-dehydrogenase (NADP+)